MKNKLSFIYEIGMDFTESRKQYDVFNAKRNKLIFMKLIKNKRYKLKRNKCK